MSIKSVSGVIEFPNTALLQEEVLVTVALVLDEGLPIGPNFLHSLSTLIETIAIHDKIFYDPRQDSLKPKQSGGRTVGDIIRESPFVRMLVKDGALAVFPNSTEIDNYLLRNGREYDFADFLTDSSWSTDSFYVSPQSELKRYKILEELVTRAPALLQPEMIVPFEKSVEDYEALKAIGMLDPEEVDAPMRRRMGEMLGFTEHDLLFIEGLNYRSRGCLDLAKNLGMQLYLNYCALPHHVGAIRNSNSKARQVYEKIRQKLDEDENDDEPVGLQGNDFWRTALPPRSAIGPEKLQGFSGGYGSRDS